MLRTHNDHFNLFDITLRFSIFFLFLNIKLPGLNASSNNPLSSVILCIPIVQLQPVPISHFMFTDRKLAAQLICRKKANLNFWWFANICIIYVIIHTDSCNVYVLFLGDFNLFESIISWSNHFLCSVFMCEISTRRSWF